MSVKTLFAATLAIALLLCFAVVAAVLYRAAVRQADAETMREARVILAAATASQNYNDARVSPLVEGQPGPFHPEGVPFFATKSIMDGFAAAFPEYSYRATALNPTNVDDFPRKWQVDVIETFRSRPSLSELSGELDDDNGSRILYIAQPIKVSDANCLLCHSEPKSAPPGMIAAYNSANGFGWKLGEVVGASFVTVPTAERLKVTVSNVFWFLIALGCVLVIGIMVALFVIHHAVVKQALRLAEQADKLSAGDPEGAELQEEGPAEFRMLARAINRLHRSLAAALGELRERSF